MKINFSRWMKKIAESDPEEGVGIARTLVLSAIVGAAAGLGAVLLVSMLQVGDWFFLGKLANYAPSVPGGQPEMFKNLPEIFGEPRRFCFYPCWAPSFRVLSF